MKSEEKTSSEDGEDKLTKNATDHHEEHIPPTGLSSLQWLNSHEGVNGSVVSNGQVTFRLIEGQRLKKLRIVEPTSL